MTRSFAVKTFLIFLGLIVLLPFQNCGDFSLKEQLLLEQGLTESAAALDNKLLAGLISSESLMLWSKASDPNYIKKSIMADQWSIIVVVDRSSSGQVLKINSASEVEETILSVQNGIIRASRFNKDTPFEEYLEAPTPSQGDKMVLAVSVGAKASEILLMVNGMVQMGTLVSSGSPGNFTYLSKQVSSQLTQGQIYEYIVYAGDSSSGLGKLTGSELNVMSRNLARSLSVSNVLLDPSLIKEPIQEAPSVEFVAAKAFFDANCISCHRSGAVSPNLVGLTQERALSSGLVLKKNAYESKLYYRLQHSAGPNGPKNMPSGSASDAQKVEAWINSIN
jgi:hypothetical protein